MGIEKNSIDKFDVFIVDAYGVFNFGKGISLPVIDIFKSLLEYGKKVYILSNTTDVNDEFIKNYENKGVLKGVHYTDVMTSGQLALEDIQSGNLHVKGTKYYVFGAANFENLSPIPSIFANSSYELVGDVKQADFIYCGIPQLIDKDGCPYYSTKVSDFEDQVANLVNSGKQMMIANPDMTASVGDQFVIMPGSIGKLYQEKKGKTVIYGKPDPRIFNTLLERYCPNVDKNRVLMIGDTLRTDIKGAKQADIRGCLVFEGGVTEYEVGQRGISLADYIKQENIYPNYIWNKICKGPLFED
jgi:HAD superfamily hydrolase (TIGR01459 family)